MAMEISTSTEYLGIAYEWMHLAIDRRLRLSHLTDTATTRSLPYARQGKGKVGGLGGWDIV